MRGLDGVRVGRYRALLKVCYLLAVTALVFALPATGAPALAQWLVIAGLLALQASVLVVCRVELRAIARPVWKLKWLFALLIVFYGLLPPETACCDTRIGWSVPGLGWTLSINLTGLEQAGLMCLQILTVLLTSTVVRATGSGRDLVEGLKAFRLPDLFVHALDQTLNTFLGARRPGHRREGGARSGGFFSVIREMSRGDFSAFVKTIEGNMALADERTREGRRLDASLAHDVAIVTGVALCMASLKVLKVLPGLPFASGHKTFLLFPLYVLAARLTHSRWGGTAAGSIMGVIGFLQGDGRFGVLEIFKHIAPGLVIDLGEPLARRLPPWALGYCVLGFAAAIARTATEFLLVLLLGARAEIYLFPAARLVPNLLAGTLSGFVTVVVLRAFASLPPVEAGPFMEPEPSSHEPDGPPSTPQGLADVSKANASDQPSPSSAERTWAPGSGGGGGGGKGRGRKAGPRPP
jgi:hypothetical protein